MIFNYYLMVEAVDEAPQISMQNGVIRSVHYLSVIDSGSFM